MLAHLFIIQQVKKRIVDTHVWGYKYLNCYKQENSVVPMLHNT